MRFSDISWPSLVWPNTVDHLLPPTQDSQIDGEPLAGGDAVARMINLSLWI
ncbi:MAG: hypothetical protein AB7P69_09810 [Candidatus Binatia bacterium]